MLKSTIQRGRTYSEEEIRDIVGNINWKSHVREVETVRRPDQRDRNDVVHHKLLEVLARLLHTEDKHNSLLSPVRALKKVIKLKVSVQRLVWVSLEHARHSEVPDRGMAHDPESQWSSAAKIDSRVHLFHKTCLLGPRLKTGLDSQWC